MVRAEDLFGGRVRRSGARVPPVPLPRTPTLAPALSVALALGLCGCDEPARRGVGGGALQPGGAEVVLVANGLAETFSVLVRGEAIRNNWGRTGAAPNFMALRGGEGFLVSSLSHAIQVFDPATLLTRREIGVGRGTNPMEIAFLSDDPADLRAYVSLFLAGSVDLVDLAPDPVGSRRLASIDLEGIVLPVDRSGLRTRAFPGGLARVGRRLFIALANLTDAYGGLTAGGPGVLAAIDADPSSPAFDEIVGTAELTGRDPVSVRAFPEDPAVLFVACAGRYDAAGGGGFAGDGRVDIVDSVSLEVLGSIATGGAPLEVAFAPDGTGYAADGMRPEIAVFDARAAAARARASSSPPEDLSDLLRAPIVLRAGEGFVSGLAVAPDGTLFALDFAADALDEIDPAGVVVATYATGDGPDAIAIHGGEAPLAPGRVRIEGVVWLGPLEGAQVTVRPAFPPDAREIASARADAEGRFALQFEPVPGALLIAVGDGVLHDPARGETIPMRPGERLRALLPELPEEGEVEIAVTPWTEIACALALGRGDLRPAAVRAAADRIGRYLGGIDLDAVPSFSPAAAEGARTSGFLIGGLARLAAGMGLASPLDLAAALGRDAEDGRFDGKRRGRPIALDLPPGASPPEGILGPDATLLPEAGWALLADATRSFAASPANPTGEGPPAAILDHLRLAKGWIPPAGRPVDLDGPRAEAGDDRVGRAGEPVLFDGSRSWDAAGIALFAWDFDEADGGGPDALGPTASHAYREPGAYTAVLEVFDAFGNAAGRSVSVRVEPPPPGPRIVVEPPELWLEGPGDGFALRASVVEQGREAPAHFAWETSNSVLAVDPDGTVRALAYGEGVVRVATERLAAEVPVHVGGPFIAEVHRDEVYVPTRGEAPRIDVHALGGGPPLRIFDLRARRGSDGAIEEVGVPALVDPVGIAFLGPWRGYVLGKLPESGTSGVASIDTESGAVLDAVALGGPGFRRIAALSGAVIAAGRDAVVLVRGDPLGLDAARFAPGPPIADVAVDLRGRPHVLSPGPAGGPCRVWVLDPVDLAPIVEVALALAPGGRAASIATDPFSDCMLVGDGEALRLYAYDARTFDVLRDGRNPLRAGGRGRVARIHVPSPARLVLEDRAGGRAIDVELDRPLSAGAAEARVLSARPRILPRSPGTPRFRPQEPDRPAVYADRLIAYAPRGIPGDFTNPILALGPPRGRGDAQGSLHATSLGDRDGPAGPVGDGLGGSITLGFWGKRIVDGPGPDLRIFENPQLVAGDRRVRWIEACVVQVSRDGHTWRTFPVRVRDAYPANDPRHFEGVAGLEPCYTNADPADPFYRPQDARDPAAGGDAFDLADVGLPWARCVRLVDGGSLIADDGNAPSVAQRGADIDAVAARNWEDDPGAGEPDRTPPRAAIDGPSVVRVGEIFVLSGEPSEDDRGIVWYAWDLDATDGIGIADPDGGHRPDAVGPAIEVRFASPGTRTVTLAVIDEGGNLATAEAAIDVR